MKHIIIALGIILVGNFAYATDVPVPTGFKKCVTTTNTPVFEMSSFEPMFKLGSKGNTQDTMIEALHSINFYSDTGEAVLVNFIHVSGGPTACIVKRKSDGAAGWTLTPYCEKFVCIEG